TSAKEFAGLAAGSHTVWVKDANGCEKSAQITVGTPTVVTLGLSKTDVLCFGDSNGKVTATFGGGTGPYMAKIDAGAYAAATSAKEFAGLAAGSHTVWVKDANGCEKSAQITVGTPTAVALTANGTEFCQGQSGTITFSATGGTGNKTYTVNGNSASSPFSVSTNGTYTIVATDANGCKDTKQVNVIVNPLPDADAGPAKTLTCITKSVILGGSSVTAGATYAWVASNGGNIVSGADTLTPTVDAVGTYTLTVTSLAGCKASDEVSVDLNTATPTPLGVKNLEICFPLPINLREAILDVLSPEVLDKITFWRDSQATADQITPADVLNYTAEPGEYVIYLKQILEATGCPTVQQFSIKVESCSVALCTYTQGYYGNAGGKSCAGEENGTSYSTAGLIQKALESYPSSIMTIGLPGRSVWIKSTEDIDDIIRVLPGGGSSYVLPLADKKISDIAGGSSSYLKKGKINSTLLAQTITLGLNLGINSELGDFVLQSGKLATAAPLGGCGSDIPMPRSCSYDIYTPTINEYKYFDIPAVVNLLPNKTVKGLFDMANKALGGGTLPAGITLSSLASAVDIINNAFDECRISMGYNQKPLTCIEDRASFIVNPVPIVSQATVTYKFSYASPVTIEVRSTVGGILLATYQDPTPSSLDKQVLLPYNFTASGTYIITVITNIGSSSRQVIKN
ncbi:MAG: hypothetical protein H7Y10_15890, partial [Flavobacterium sp.]|nr:hypothetical protein [Flavobacterium sp.]